MSEERSQPDVSVVLPTYNERQSVGLALRQLDDVLSKQRFSSEILVIDDSSADGTAEIARSTLTRVPLRVIVRKERGLASAILTGLQDSKGRVCVALDCDGSHPTSLVPELANKVLSGEAEMAVASRYVPGGGIADWSYYRRFLSAGATLLARPLLHRSRVKDPMSGFFAVDKVVLAREAVNPIGFKIAFEIIVRCRPFPVVEVPYQFRDRVAGRSKLSGKQAAAFLRHLGRLYRFSLFGSSPHAAAGKA